MYSPDSPCPILCFLNQPVAPSTWHSEWSILSTSCVRSDKQMLIQKRPPAAKAKAVTAHAPPVNPLHDMELMD
eukprot:7668305-Prorocentrum_lima.AAC.1